MTKVRSNFDRVVGDGISADDVHKWHKAEVALHFNASSFLCHVGFTTDVKLSLTLI